VGPKLGDYSGFDVVGLSLGNTDSMKVGPPEEDKVSALGPFVMAMWLGQMSKG
jgi:hypothetical protein